MLSLMLSMHFFVDCPFPPPLHDARAQLTAAEAREGEDASTAAGTDEPTVSNEDGKAAGAHEPKESKGGGEEAGAHGTVRPAARGDGATATTAAGGPPDGGMEDGRAEEGEPCGAQGTRATARILTAYSRRGSAA